MPFVFGGFKLDCTHKCSHFNTFCCVSVLRSREATYFKSSVHIRANGKTYILHCRTAYVNTQTPCDEPSNIDFRLNNENKNLHSVYIPLKLKTRREHIELADNHCRMELAPRRTILRAFEANKNTILDLPVHSWNCEWCGKGDRTWWCGIGDRAGSSRGTRDACSRSGPSSPATGGLGRRTAGGPNYTRHNAHHSPVLPTSRDPGACRRRRPFILSVRQHCSWSFCLMK